METIAIEKIESMLSFLMEYIFEIKQQITRKIFFCQSKRTKKLFRNKTKKYYDNRNNEISE